MNAALEVARRCRKLICTLSSPCDRIKPIAERLSDLNSLNDLNVIFRYFLPVRIKDIHRGDAEFTEFGMFTNKKVLSSAPSAPQR